MKITLLILLALSGIFTNGRSQDQIPELPNYLADPYFSRNENQNKHDLVIKFRPRCNKDWGPTVANLYDRESTNNSAEVIAIFLNEDESPKSAEWEVSTKTDE